MRKAVDSPRRAEPNTSPSATPPLTVADDKRSALCELSLRSGEFGNKECGCFSSAGTVEGAPARTMANSVTIHVFSHQSD
jgi:hypothetical protein